MKKNQLTNDEIEDLKNRISKYGKVEVFEEKDEMFFVKITDGFSIKMTNVIELSKLLTSEIPYPILHKFKTDNNLFYLILKR